MSTNIKMLQTFPEMYFSSQESVNQRRSSLRTRLVWYVGISGYVLLNSKELWKAISLRERVGLDILWLSLPWVICSLLGAVTYFLVDEAARKNDNFL